MGVIKGDRSVEIDAPIERCFEIAANIEAALASLQSSVAAAKSERTASSVSAVGMAIEGVTSSLSAMQDAVSGTC